MSIDSEFIDGYRVEKNGLGWCVVCGDGTRILFRSVREHTSQVVAAELRTAFADGLFVGMQKAHNTADQLRQAKEK